jgi:hypothetical protein
MLANSMKVKNRRKIVRVPFDTLLAEVPIRGEVPFSADFCILWEEIAQESSGVLRKP